MNIFTGSLNIGSMNLIASIVSILAVTVILMDNGFYKWAALTMIFTSESNGKKLFFHTLLLTIVGCGIFNFYGIIAVLAPIEYEIVKALQLKKLRALPFIYLMVLVIDILFLSHIGLFKNIIVHDLSEIVIISLIVFYFYKDLIKNNFSSSQINNPDDHVKDWIIFNIGLLVIIIDVIIYYISSAKHINYMPIYVITTMMLFIARIIRKNA